MSGEDDLTRRRLLRAGIGGMVGAGTLASSAAASGPVEDTLETIEGAAPAPVEGTLDSLGPIPAVPIEDQTETVPATAVPERAAGIRPGSQLIISKEGSGSAACTANFVWADGAGTRYLGAAGHCFLQFSLDSPNVAMKGGENETALGDLTVSVCTDCTFGGQLSNVVQGSSVELGDVVYARQAPDGGGNGIGHDFGLVEIPADHRGLVDPSLPQFGGPSGGAHEAVPAGQRVGLYGAGVGSGEVYLTQARRGLSLGGDADSWSAAIRATPGDSGGPLVGGDGWNWLSSAPQAAGILTHGSTNGIGGTTIGQCTALATEPGSPITDLSVVTPD